MAPKCCVTSCGATRKWPNLTFHQLPANEAMRNKWLDSIGRHNVTIAPYRRHVCSLHFEESSFNRTLKVIRLRDDAVPLPFIIVGAVASNDKTSENRSKKNTLIKLKSADEKPVIQPEQKSAPPPLKDHKRTLQEQRDKERINRLTVIRSEHRKRIKRLNARVRRSTKRLQVLIKKIEDFKKKHRIVEEKTKCQVERIAETEVLPTNFELSESEEEWLDEGEVLIKDNFQTRLKGEEELDEVQEEWLSVGEISDDDCVPTAENDDLKEVSRYCRTITKQDYETIRTLAAPESDKKPDMYILMYDY